MARSPSRSRSRSPRRRRERDWRGDRDRERERGYERERERDRELRSRGDRGRLGERDRGRDRDDRGRRRERERERGRSGSPRHDYQRAPSDDHEGRRDGRARGRSRDEILEFKLPKKVSERREDEVMKDSEGQRAAIVAEFVDGIAREHEQLVEASMHSSPAVLQAPGPPAVPQPNEEDFMKKLGIPVGFNTTKGKYVGDANHSAVKLTTKRQPRQYMNRRGGFNRPLPAETNR